MHTVAEVKLLQRGGAAKDAESCIRHFSASMVRDTYGCDMPSRNLCITRQGVNVSFMTTVDNRLLSVP